MAQDPMTPGEKMELARMVAAELVRLAATGTLPSGIGDLAANVDGIECFTCSGRFKCRPSFLIQAPPSQPTG
ncbi:MAG: hypothetical protein AB7O80_01565 [Acetobacteraceae bacterium]